ncbi:Tiny macrocysts protein B [Tetrabaena socialis]|uniref:Tiny macrocysts protein B n=1 Tax=Tetrabaena socialis TaxID=47790 RepID=A0A2J7ZY05_9CHLO|nr:Tiny macrocysts protein B [Tetrabaena socialis]|eukprot:PNH05154.1 Tiny macrocysts protein B [Tetrabaena socialis]
MSFIARCSYPRNKQPNVPLHDVCQNLDDPRDVEIVARCCRVWTDGYTLAPEAVAKAQSVIKAGLAMFPSSAYMVLLHANFMIDVLGVTQSGGRRIEDARKLNPGIMCRFISFVRQQQATQRAAGHNANDGASMDLLGYVEYQRKQRMVVRLHREALQAMKLLDAHTVSFTRMARLLGKIEGSVSQAQTAYRVCLENYGSSPKLVRLYGKFLEGCKYDPWGAQEYYTEADRESGGRSGTWACHYCCHYCVLLCELARTFMA